MNSQRGVTILVSAFCAAVLSGCMTAPPPDDYTTAWTPPDRAKKKDQTWNDIRSRQANFSSPLALSELTDIALRNNPATREAWNRARAASEQVKQARGYLMPSLTATAAAGRQKVQADPEGFDSDTTQYGPGLELSYWIINFGGGRRAAVEAALETVFAADYAFNRSIQDVLLAVETTYYGLISARAGVDAAEATLKDAESTLDAARESKNAGIGTQLDVLQAQASRDQARYSLASAKGALKQARAALAQAIGVPADSALEVIEPENEIAAAVNEPDMARLIDDALDRRPDIAALRSTLAADLARAKATGAPLWPSLYLDGAVNRNYYDADDESERGFQDDDWTYGATLSLRWTLFDGLQTISAKRAALAQAEASRALLEQAEIAASAEVWTRFYEYETALEKYEFSSAYLESSAASYDLAMTSYKAGLQSILDLLTAESQLAEARSLQVASRQETFIALANLAYATGMLEAGGSVNTQDSFSITTNKDDQL